MKMHSVVLLLVFALIQVKGADEGASKNPDEKVYVVYTRGVSSESGGGVVITQLAKEEFHGIICISGIGLEDHIKGVPIRMPVENIVMIMEYDGKDAWKKAIRDYKSIDSR